MIHQTLRRVVVSHLTAESRSHTLVADIINDESGFRLAGLYVNNPRLPRQDTSRIHHGGLLLHIQVGERPRLHGSYWTDRATHGELEFVLVERAQVTDFASAQALADRHNFGFKPVLPLPNHGTDIGTRGHLVATGAFVDRLGMFFQSAFSDDELRRFAGRLDPDSDPANRLPGAPAPPATLADALARLIIREGWEERALALLLVERSQRKVEIESLRTQLGRRA